MPVNDFLQYSEHNRASLKERDMVISDAPLPKGRTHGDYKNWASRVIMENKPDGVETAKRELVNIGRWTPDQADALFDVPSQQVEFLYNTQTQMDLLKSEDKLLREQQNKLSVQFNALQQQENPHGFNADAQEIEMNLSEVKKSREKVLDQQLSIIGQINSQVNRFGENSQTSLMMRESAANIFNIVDSDNEYVGRTDGIYKNGVAMDSTMLDDIKGNLGEYGMIGTTAAAAGAFDYKIKKAYDSAGPKMRKALRIGGMAGIALEVGASAYAIAAARESKRQEIADKFGEIIQDDYAEQQFKKDVQDELLIGAGAVGAGAVLGRVLYGVFGKGEVVSSQAFEVIRNKSGLDDAELDALVESYEATMPKDFKIKLTNRLWPTKALHSVKRPEAMTTTKEVKFSELSREEKVVAALYHSGNPRYQTTIINTVENRPFIRQEAALNNAIKISETVRGEFDKLRNVMRPEEVLNYVYDKTNFARRILNDTVFTKKLDENPKQSSN